MSASERWVRQPQSTQALHGELSRILCSRWDPIHEVGDVDPKILPGNPPHIDVNEGPEILKHGDKIFLTHSVSACWTDYYSLGMLTAVSGSDLLNAAAWTKSSAPVFEQSPEAGVYATGHNSSSNRPTEGTGFSTMQTLHRVKAAAGIGLRGPNLLCGRQTACAILANPFQLTCRSGGPRSSCRVLPARTVTSSVFYRAAACLDIKDLPASFSENTLPSPITNRCAVVFRSGATCSSNCRLARTPHVVTQPLTRIAEKRFR